MSTPTDAQPSPIEAPPEVDATLTRLTAHKNVLGVLILARPTGIILRSAGPLFAPSPSSTAPVLSEEPVVLVSAHSEVARRYAKLAQRLVESVGSEVREVREVEEDELRFLRIRSRKHELLITPDPLYILIVVQDPGA